MTDKSYSKPPTEGRIKTEDIDKYSRLRRLLRPLMGMWYVHPDITLIAYGSPAVVLGMLVTSSKPSTDRLHLRNLFAHGRRYHFVGGSPNGFRMETTSKIPWRRRDRTRATAVLTAQFKQLDDDLTQINLTAHIRLASMYTGFIVPIFFTPLFLFAAWHHPLVRLLMLVSLYGLAWTAYRYSAAVDANDMVYFIEQSLADLMPKSVTELGAHVPYVVDNREDFADAWEKFYESHTEDDTSN